jgi:hypothetical protein
MSQRHRTSDDSLPPREEVSAHKHSERQRIQSELKNVAHQVSSGMDPEDVHEPGAAWKPSHHHDAEVAKTKLLKRKRSGRHWKTKMWKRRSAMRQARAQAIRMAGEG